MRYMIKFVITHQTVQNNENNDNLFISHIFDAFLNSLEFDQNI